MPAEINHEEYHHRLEIQSQAHLAAMPEAVAAADHEPLTEQMIAESVRYQIETWAMSIAGTWPELSLADIQVEAATHRVAFSVGALYGLLFTLAVAQEGPDYCQHCNEAIALQLVTEQLRAAYGSVVR